MAATPEQAETDCGTPAAPLRFGMDPSPHRASSRSCRHCKDSISFVSACSGVWIHDNSGVVWCPGNRTMAAPNPEGDPFRT